MDKAVVLLLILAGLAVPALQAWLSLIVLEYSFALSLVAFLAAGISTIIAFHIAAKRINGYLNIEYKVIAKIACLPAMLLYPLALGVMMNVYRGMGMALIVWACIMCEIYDAVLFGSLLSKAKDDCLY